MAFVNPSLSPEQENQFAPVGSTTPNPMSLLPPQSAQTGGSAGSGSTSGAAPTQATPTQFGSNASKLSDYLSANADQTQTMGSNIAGNLTSQYGQVQGDVTQAGQTALGQVTAGTPQYDPNLVGQFQQNPKDFASNPENVSGFQKMFNASYTGPQNFETTPAYSNIQKEVQGAVQNADLVNTFPGLSTYLQNKAQGTYTPGMNTLDTVLLQGNQPAYKAVTDAAKPFSGLDKYLGDTTAQVNSAIPQAQQAAQSAKDQTRSAYNDYAGDFTSGVSKAYQDAVGKATNYNNLLNDITGKVGAGNLADLDPQETAYIGMNGSIPDLLSSYSSIWGPQAKTINAGNFFNPGATANMPTGDRVMTPGQVDIARALQTLSGSPLSLPFAMPESGSATPYDVTGLKSPSFDSKALLQELLTDTGNINSASPDQAVQANNLNKRIASILNGPATGPGPTTPPPAPGSSGDLGAGFHWDDSSGKWVPTIPLQPQDSTPLPTGGGGRVTR